MSFAARSPSYEPPETVVPAKAGTHPSAIPHADEWVPAFAGMTVLEPQKTMSKSFMERG